MAQIRQQKSSTADRMPHTGHRERLRKKWKTGSFLEKHEFLEILLFFCISRRNTNEIAHALLDRFGSLHGILDAPESALLEVKGVGPQTVFFLKLLSELISRYQEERVDKKRMFHSRKEIYTYVSSLFIGSSTEKVYLLLFNSSGRLLACERIGDGFAAMSEFSLKKINQLAVRFDATSAMLAHNHPDGLAQPSIQDIKTTKKVEEALGLLGVTLSDHLIVTGDRCVSVLRESLRLPPQ